MKRRKIILIVMLLVLPMTVGGVKFVSETEDKLSMYQITYLDEMSSKVANGIRRLSTDECLILDFSQDAYVLNQYSLGMLEKENIAQYLEDGGIIVVNDNEVTSEDLKSKVDTNVAEFDYSKEKHHYGFYLYNDGETNVTVNVTLGYLCSDAEENTEEKIVSEEIEKETIVEDVVSYAVAKSSISPVISIVGDTGGGASGGGTVSQSNTSGQVIATAYLQNILYIDDGDEKACSYTIYTQVIDVAKVQDTSDVTRGVYDVVSTFTIDAEPDYRITEYGVRMQNFATILDASYLNSTTSTSVSLGGSLGFQGNVIQGSITEGVSYTYTPDSQEILNDLPAGSNKYWHSEVTNPTYNASRKLMPSIRVMNSNDVYNTYEYSRVEELYIEDDSWWIFKSKYSMADEYRKELGICWNSNGFVSQVTYTG